METWIINSISRELSSVWKLTKYICLGIYWNKYILSKIILLFLLFVGTSPAKHTVVPLCVLRNTPTSFATAGSACGIATKKQAQPAFGEWLYLNLNVINYFTCKTILVWFSTNFIFALFATLTKSAERVRREKVE